ncbi:MAG: hypothetical protein QM820_22135 [Minicystis sp.]
MKTLRVSLRKRVGVSRRIELGGEHRAVAGAVDHVAGLDALAAGEIDAHALLVDMDVLDAHPFAHGAPVFLGDPGEVLIDVLPEIMDLGALERLRDGDLIDLLGALEFPGAVVRISDVALHPAGGRDVVVYGDEAHEVEQLGHLEALGEDLHHHRGLADAGLAHGEARVPGGVGDEDLRAVAGEDRPEDAPGHAGAQNRHVVHGVLLLLES